MAHYGDLANYPLRKKGTLEVPTMTSFYPTFVLYDPNSPVDFLPVARWLTADGLPPLPISRKQHH